MYFVLSARRGYCLPPFEMGFNGGTGAFI